ncbi:MAG: alpha/beta hydrolase [Dehalococcoidia bacterium]|nr:alpha/beta hydrolase [Chloroflexi bacterium CFX7]MCK6566019.1 alpha/beta hydrolase [Dehalococcoidia bacterium]NUQ55573.1 alpha/beta hydrolase [Dehalococcoidia bacterium]RIL02831.1 MAG: hypothetical protein DCC78_05130 [bacterium]
MTIAEQQRVEVEQGVVFGTGGGRDLRCDVYHPPAAVKNGIGVLLVHGGRWIQGDRTQLRGYGILLGRKGYTCVASEYRLVPESPWPACLHDVKAAIRWMRTNAGRLGIDPEKIVIEGNSAGAHLVLMAAGTPGRPEFEGQGGNPGVSTAVAAVIAFYPPTALDSPNWRTRIHPLFGREASADELSAASPMTYVNAAFPPTLLIHGNGDELVPAAESTDMYGALHAAKVPVELHMYAGQPHAFDAGPQFGRQCADIMALFIERVVR